VHFDIFQLTNDEARNVPSLLSKTACVSELQLHLAFRVVDVIKRKKVTPVVVSKLPTQQQAIIYVSHLIKLDK
jgi:hypothetical protein